MPLETTANEKETSRQQETRPKLSQRLRAGLDAARGCAACYVALYHVANARGWTTGIGELLRFGQEAVLVFFLLSGFVIFANERSRAAESRGYYLRRLRRIYPGLIGAMVVSTLVAIDNHTLLAEFKWQELLGTLASLQDISGLKPGVIVGPYLGNDPLWSLSYEVAFYIIFPFVLGFWKRQPAVANHVIGIVCCAAYIGYMVIPNHWFIVIAYFLVWWCGAMAAAAYFRGAQDFRGIGAPLYWLLTLVVIAIAAVPIEGYEGPGRYPFLMARHFGAGLVMLVAFFGQLGAAFASLVSRIAYPASAIASVSYGIYVLHYPLLVDWHRARSLWGLAAAAILMAFAAHLVDHQINRLLPRAPIG